MKTGDAACIRPRTALMKEFVSVFLYNISVVSIHIMCTSAVHIINKGFPTLIVGNHELRGKAEDLRKPFAILKKVKGDSSSKVRYEIGGIVTKKILFDKIPKSILR
jgi:hypothetical protein